MTPAEKIPVWVAHRSPLIFAGLNAVLAKQHDFEVVCADSEPGGVQLNQWPESAGVLVTDRETGLRLLNEEGRRGWRIVIVTDDNSVASIRHAVQSGANGYLLLSSTSSMVAGAVRRAMQGEATFDPLVSAKMSDAFSRDALTARETEILQLLMRGLGNKAIANIIDRTVGTVKTHVKAILAKLQAASRTEAVAVATRRGLVTESASPRNAVLRTRHQVHLTSLHGADARSPLLARGMAV
jgi:DNA-binding NarL/FixJ family response regulator